MGNISRQASKTFQINVGLDGNVFNRNFDHLGKLAEKGWSKSTWQLYHRFRVSLILCASNGIPPMYQQDKEIMKCLLEYVIYSIEDLSVLNIVNCEKLKKSAVSGRHPLL